MLRKSKKYNDLYSIVYNLVKDKGSIDFGDLLKELPKIKKEWCGCIIHDVLCVIDDLKTNSIVNCIQTKPGVYTISIVE